MSIVFFEGFNFSDSDAVKLDSNYWSINDITKISFEGGRTGNRIVLASRSSFSSTSGNNVLTLSNINPLLNNNAVGLGFHVSEYSVISGPTSRSYSVSPYIESFVSFHDSSSEVLSINVIKTTYNGLSSIGFGIYQGGTLVTTYDLRSVAGHSWGLQDFSTAGMSVTQASFFEIYLDPKINNQLAIRFSANNTINAYLLNSNNNIYTNISGFNSLSSIKFYSISDSTGYLRKLDDLYVAGGNSASECLLGQNTRIYRLSPNDDVSSQWQTRVGGVTNPMYTPQWSTINNNDGDGSYIFASTSGTNGIYGITNLSNDAPSGIGGIKLINIAKKTSVDENKTFVNIASSGNGGSIQEIGQSYTVDSTNYDTYSNFLFDNPITGSGWSTSDINNLQLGVKIV